MFKILDGRDNFYQWDIDRKIVVEDRTIKEVHFCNKTDDCSLVCEAYEEDGLWVANVPNILLQTDWRIRVYAYDGSYTKHAECLHVIARSKPADYVYTETEVKNYDALEARVRYLEEHGGGSGGTGADGGSLYYSSAQITPIASTIRKDTVTIPDGREVQIDDLILTENGYLCQVTAIKSSTYTIEKLTNIKLVDTSNIKDGSVTEAKLAPEVLEKIENAGGGAGGGLNITDDGEGNVIIETIGNSISITDDGNGNVVIQ